MNPISAGSNQNFNGIREESTAIVEYREKTKDPKFSVVTPLFPAQRDPSEPDFSRFTQLFGKIGKDFSPNTVSETAIVEYKGNEVSALIEKIKADIAEENRVLDAAVHEFEKAYADISKLSEEHMSALRNWGYRVHKIAFPWQILGDKKLTDQGVIQIETLFPNLTSLDFSRLYYNTDITRLPSLTHITELNLSDCYNFPSKVIKDFLEANKETLEVAHLTSTKIKTLPFLPKLRALTIRNCKNLTEESLAIVSRCTQLTSLELSLETLSTIPIIESLEEIKVAYPVLEPLKEIFFITLTQFPNLKKVTVPYSNIQNILPLKHIEQITLTHTNSVNKYVDKSLQRNEWNALYSLVSRMPQLAFTERDVNSYIFTKVREPLPTEEESEIFAGFPTVMTRLMASYAKSSDWDNLISSGKVAEQDLPYNQKLTLCPDAKVQKILEPLLHKLSSMGSYEDYANHKNLQKLKEPIKMQLVEYGSFVDDLDTSEFDDDFFQHNFREGNNDFIGVTFPNVEFFTCSTIQCLPARLEHVKKLTVKKPCGTLSTDPLVAFLQKNKDMESIELSAVKNFTLPVLERLQNVHIYDSSEITNASLQNLASCPMVKSVRVTGSSITTLPLGESVEELEIDSSATLDDAFFTDVLPRLTNLKTLKISAQYIDKIPPLQNVQHVEFSGGLFITNEQSAAFILQFPQLEIDRRFPGVGLSAHFTTEAKKYPKVEVANQLTVQLNDLMSMMNHVSQLSSLRGSLLLSDMLLLTCSDLFSRSLRP